MFGNIQFDPVYFVGVMFAFIVGTTLHEFMHAWTAWYLGDDTARRMGRITLNPAAHFDPLGFFMCILLALGVGFLAWGKPVPVNSAALRGGRRGMAVVAIAGPISNLVLATIFAIPLRLELPMPDILYGVISTFVQINLLLFTFNLIPIPPLDGYNILMGILSISWVRLLEPLRQYGPALLLLILFIGPYLHIYLFNNAISPILALVSRLVLGNAA